MTTSEFSDAFDISLSNYRTKYTEIGLDFDEYEKSVLLTKAQEEVVQSLYNGSAVTASFEKTEAVRRELDALVKQSEITPDTSTEDNPLSIITDSLKHSEYTLPDDCWFIVYEQVTTADSDESCTSGKILKILPVTHDEYQRIIENPFRGPNSRRAIRLDVGPFKVEIVSAYETVKYFIRYLSKPTPIVLCNIADDGLSIEGIKTVTECALNEVIHQAILDRAVQLAIASRSLLGNQTKTNS